MGDLQKLNNFRLVSFKSMDKAKWTLQDFVLSYFMFHNLDPLVDFYVYLPSLVQVECVMYQVDEQNEDQLNPNSPLNNKEKKLKKEESETSESKAKDNVFITSFGTNLKPYFELNSNAALALSWMDKRGILDKRIFDLVNDSVEYLKIESKLCGENGHKYTNIEVVDRAISIKNVDYNILHHVLYKLRKAEYDDFAIHFMDVFYKIMCIDEDIRDYEKDLLGNSFNGYRMFVRMYGKSAPEKIFLYLKELERIYHPLYDLLSTDLQQKHNSRCRDAVSESQLGAHPVTPHSYTFSGHMSWDTWYFPEPILDEEEFRKNYKPKPKTKTEKKKFITSKPDAQWKKEKLCLDNLKSTTSSNSKNNVSSDANISLSNVTISGNTATNTKLQV